MSLFNLNAIVQSAPSKASKAKVSKEKGAARQNFDLRIVDSTCTVAEHIFSKYELKDRQIIFSYTEGFALMVIYPAGIEEIQNALLKPRKDDKPKNPVFKLSHFEQVFESAFVSEETGVANTDATYSLEDITSELEEGAEGVTVLKISYTAATERKKREKKDSSAELVEILEEEENADLTATPEYL